MGRVTDWSEYYDRDELAEQREQFGIAYDDEAEAEKAYEGDGVTTDDFSWLKPNPGWENYYQAQFERY